MKWTSVTNAHGGYVFAIDDQGRMWMKKRDSWDGSWGPWVRVPDPCD